MCSYEQISQDLFLKLWSLLFLLTTFNLTLPWVIMPLCVQFHFNPLFSIWFCNSPFLSHVLLPSCLCVSRLFHPSLTCPCWVLTCVSSSGVYLMSLVRLHYVLFLSPCVCFVSSVLDLLWYTLGLLYLLFFAWTIQTPFCYLEFAGVFKFMSGFIIVIFTLLSNGPMTQIYLPMCFIGNRKLNVKSERQTLPCGCE